MKKILTQYISIPKLAVILMSTFTFISCDNALNVDPSDQYSADTFWKDQEQYNAALTSCYNNLYSSEIFFNGELDMLTPNAIAYNTANGTRTVAEGVAQTTNSLFSTFWNISYQGIGRANTLLDKIDDAPFDEAISNQMKGEALFLRALYYSYLTTYFGDCPLILKTPNAAEQSSLPRTAKAEVVDQIVTDLEQAAQLLPESYSGSNVGRATKGAALALEARVLLYNERWTESAAAAKKVMNLNIYQLFNSYRGLYLPENENNSEVIFDIQYELPYFTTRFDFVCYNLHRPSPLKSLVDAYEMIDGKSTSESPLYDPSQPYENRDPRLHQTIAVIGYPFNGKTVTLADVPITGFGQKKVTAFKDDVAQTINDNNSDLNYIVMRYAEVLLTYAEAMNEASGPSPEVFDAINQVRQRPTVNMPPLDENLTKDELRKAIHLERRIELAGEGLYYADILRWKTIETLNNGPVYDYQGDVVDNRTFNPNRDYLWAIPQTEIQENPALEQNPGW
ncbi:RagB/SusD family nutrient uptake outer membrane protein [Zhouia sp. PK063]|uniref:RagB/SusD family nutrient uptake outer membrane protein n=1 Tax=Zhouia sp. PK063 TaxID=3373602 RepID=UPI0037BCBBE1